MASLTETAYHTRRAINWAILAFIAYLILRVLWSMFVAFWLFVFPPKPPPPTHAFRTLPKLAFPAPVASPAAQLTFKLETISGGLPRASDSAVVFLMPKPGANLLGLPNTQEFAKRLGFDQNPYQETKTVYRFNDPANPLRKLRYDIASNNFVLRYTYEQDPSLFTEGKLTDKNAAIEEAIDFLDDYDLYQEDFVNGEKEVTFLRLVGDDLIPVSNISQTDAMRVDFFRSSINTLGVVTPKPDEGQIQVTITGSKNRAKRIIEVIYTYWPINYQQSATYSLKASDLAWQELLGGKGYIASYPTNGQSTAIIRNIYLGYYDSFEPQNFLQPIYVFEGDQNFKAYVPAVNPSWVEP